MSFSKFAGAMAVVLIAAALTSCGTGATPAPTIDANAIYTAAAQTLSAGIGAGMTQTAQAVTPTSVATTPLATFALATGSSPFGTQLAGGTPFNFVITPPPPGSTAVPAGTRATGGTASGAVGCNNATYVGE